MSDKRIIELPASEEIFHDDWIGKDSPLNGTSKIQVSVFMALIVEAAKEGMVPYTMLATEWTALTTYYKDQVVIYNGELYRAKDTNVSPTFNPSAWTKISFDTLYRTTLANVKNSICEEWSTSGEYTLNDCVMYDDKLYKCVADTATVGTWVSSEWELVSIYEMIQNLPKSASDVTYDNTESGLESENVQDALDEVVETITELSNTTEVTGTASGAIATFTDGADAPLKELKVTVTPVQDLHGYDGPWAGGAGKNVAKPLNNITAIGVTLSTDNLGKTTVSGTATSGGGRLVLCSSPFILPAGQYTLSHNGTDIWGDVLVVSLNGGAAVMEIRTSQERVPFIVEEEAEFVIGISVTNGVSYNGTISPQIEVGSNKTSYEPYSNICPIIGWDKAVVSVSGINVWDEEWEKGALSNLTGEPYSTSERVRSKNFIPTKPTTAYYFYAPNTYSSIRVACYDKDKNYLGQSKGWLNVSNNTSFMTPDNTYYIKFVVVKADETYDDDISINYPSTDTEYHAYNGSTYTIDLDGTRYGGVVDATNGTMTVDKVSVDLGTLNWTVANHRFNTLVPLTNAVPTQLGMCSVYKSDYGAATRTVDKSICVMNGAGFVYIYDTSKEEDAATFKTAMNGVQLVYELATPITVQLSPTPVKSLVGTNNIFADCGDINNVEYVRNLNITINDLLSRING